MTAGLLALCAAVSPVRAEPVPAPDHSLAIQKYLDAGVPPIDKPWTPEEFRKAAKVLEDMAAKDVTQLPRYNSKASGVLFAHIIAQENLYGFANKDIPVDTRIKLVNDAAAYLPLFVLYTHSVSTERTFDAEMLELGGFILRMEMAESGVFGEFMAAHPEKKDDARTQAGFVQMRDSVERTAGALLDLMMDRTYVRTAEATRFARELNDNLPR